MTQPHHSWLHFFFIHWRTLKYPNIYNFIETLQSFMTEQPQCARKKKRIGYIDGRISKFLTFFSGSRAPETATESSSSFSLFWGFLKKKIKSESSNNCSHSFKVQVHNSVVKRTLKIQDNRRQWSHLISSEVREGN